MKYAEIRTSGHCQKAFGPGHWSVLILGDQVHALEGYVDKTTSKRMELTAVIKGLKSFKKPHAVKIAAASQYVKEGMTKRIHEWKSNNWETLKGDPIKNKDLWIELDEAIQKHQVFWE